jgi:hypothetical protein
VTKDQPESDETSLFKVQLIALEEKVGNQARLAELLEISREHLNRIKSEKNPTNPGVSLKKAIDALHKDIFSKFSLDRLPGDPGIRFHVETVAQQKGIPLGTLVSECLLRYASVTAEILKPTVSSDAGGVARNLEDAVIAKVEPLAPPLPLMSPKDTERGQRAVGQPPDGAKD